MEITLTQMLIVLFPLTVSQATGLCMKDISSGFRVCDSHDEVVTVDATLLRTASCRDGPSSFPGGLSTGDAVAHPRNIKVSVYNSNFSFQSKLGRYPGLRASWNFDPDQASVTNTKGFYVRMVEANTGKLVCRLIDMQNISSKSALVDHDLVFNAIPFAGNSREDFQVAVFSLPPPEDVESLKARIIATLQAKHNYGENPSDSPIFEYPQNWRTWIVTELDEANGDVHVTFGYPSEDSLASFTVFDVQLIAHGASNPLQQKTNTRSSGEIKEGYNVFSEVPDGTYRIQIMPRDQHFQDDANCECWKPYQSFAGKDCGTCYFSLTAYFNFTNTVRDQSNTPTVAAPTGMTPAVTTPNVIVVCISSTAPRSMLVLANGWPLAVAVVVSAVFSAGH